MNNITIVYLEDACRVHSLSAGALKKDLVARVSMLIKLLVVHDNIDAHRLLDQCEAQPFLHNYYILKCFFAITSALSLFEEKFDFPNYY